jgi:hypothetical protein
LPTVSQRRRSVVPLLSRSGFILFARLRKDTLMRNLASALAVLAICVAAAPRVTADQPAKGEKIRVLVTVGGHGYEEAPF